MSKRDSTVCPAALTVPISFPPPEGRIRRRSWWLLAALAVSLVALLVALVLPRTDSRFTWSRPLPIPTTQSVVAAADPSGSIYVAAAPSPGGARGSLTRYDPSGERDWTTPLGANDSLALGALALGGDGAFVSYSQDGAPAGQEHDIHCLVAAYSSRGDPLWTKEFAKAPCQTTLAADGSGAYVQSSSNLPDVASRIAHYGVSGRKLWDRPISGALAQIRTWIYVIGLIADPTGLYVISTTGVQKFNENGNDRWTRLFSFRAFSAAPSFPSGVVVAGTLPAVQTSSDPIVPVASMRVEMLGPDGRIARQWPIPDMEMTAVGGLATDPSGVFISGHVGKEVGFDSVEEYAVIAKLTLEGGLLWTWRSETPGQQVASLCPIGPAVVVALEPGRSLPGSASVQTLSHK